LNLNKKIEKTEASPKAPKQLSSDSEPETPVLKEKNNTKIIKKKRAVIEDSSDEENEKLVSD